MYEGYLEVGGVPIINAEATEAYVANLAPNMAFHARFHTDKLHQANEEPRYRTPTLDAQPWVNPLDDASQDFYGLYPLSIEGMDDSTLSTTVVEHLAAGGSTQTSREGSRAIRVSGLIVAASKLGAQAGLSWLRAVVRDDGCDTCNGNQMRYFLAEPEVCDPAFGDVSGSRRRSFGSVQEGTIRYAFQVQDLAPRAMPSDATWSGTFSEGTLLLWGASEIGSVTPLEIHGPVAPSRRNYLPNPTLRTGLTGWDVSAASGSAWVPIGGVDAGGYVQVFGGSSGSATTYGAHTYGTGTYGRLTSTIVTSSTQPLAAGPIAAGVAMRSTTGASVTVTIRAVSSGSVVGSQTFTPGPDWSRFVALGSLGATGMVSVEFASSGASFDVDQATLETTTADLGYFDGSTQLEEYVNAWSGLPDNSDSTMLWTGAARVQRADSAYRPFISILNGGADSLQLSWVVRDEVDMTTQLLPYERFFYEVACTQGPQVIKTMDLGNHGYFIQVDFDFAVGNPFSYGAPVPIPVAAPQTQVFTDPDPFAPLDDAWLLDPDCVAPSLPPAAPVILGNCIDTIKTWQRYYVPIPAAEVADWAASVPVITINSLGDPVKQVRVRFHPNPFSYDVTRVDPLAFCSEFILSYLPGNATLTVDGIGKQVTASKAGKATVSANHLLYGSNGGPVTWPELSCAVPYVMTLDVPTPSDRDLFDIDLTLAIKE